MKYFFPHQPYGRQKVYVDKLMKASLERLTHLIKVCDLLLQTKVYLFWKNHQRLTPEFFTDLKAYKCLSFEDVFPTQSAEAVASRQKEEDALLNSIHITINISNKLPKSGQIFSAEEQWSISFVTVSFTM